MDNYNTSNPAASTTGYWALAIAIVAALAIGAYMFTAGSSLTPGVPNTGADITNTVDTSSQTGSTDASGATAY